MTISTFAGTSTDTVNSHTVASGKVSVSVEGNMGGASIDFDFLDELEEVSLLKTPDLHFEETGCRVVELPIGAEISPRRAYTDSGDARTAITVKVLDVYALEAAP